MHHNNQPTSIWYKQSHRIHGTGMFTYIYHNNQPSMWVKGYRSSHGSVMGPWCLDHFTIKTTRNLPLENGPLIGRIWYPLLMQGERKWTYWDRKTPLKINMEHIIIGVCKIMFRSKWVICRFHVYLPGCVWTTEPLMGERLQNISTNHRCRIDADVGPSHTPILRWNILVGWNENKIWEFPKRMVPPNHPF